MLRYFSLAIRHYADFKTRTTRKQFWMFQLCYIIIWFCLLIGMCVASVLISLDVHASLSGFAVVGSIFADLFLLLVVLFYLFMLIPRLSIAVRRLHDVNLSGWMLLLLLVPLAGAITLFVFTCLKGEPEANAYGPAPESLGIKTADQSA